MSPCITTETDRSLSKPTFPTSPVAGISESDARDNGRGKKRRHRPVVGEKASGKRELYLFHSVSTRASIQRMADFYIDFFFSFPSFEGKKGLMEEACEKVLEMD